MDGCIVLAVVGGDAILDRIPLHQVKSVESLSGSFFSQEEQELPLIDKSSDFDENIYAIKIVTVEDGFNRGRTYYLRVDSNKLCKHLEDEISKLATACRARCNLILNFMKMNNEVLAE